MKNDEYKCDMCGGVFKYMTKEEDVVKEFNTNFPGENVEDSGIICDDCYKLLIEKKIIDVKLERE